MKRKKQMTPRQLIITKLLLYLSIKCAFEEAVFLATLNLKSGDLKKKKNSNIKEIF